MSKLCRLEDVTTKERIEHQLKRRYTKQYSHLRICEHRLIIKLQEILSVLTTTHKRLGSKISQILHSKTKNDRETIRTSNIINNFKLISDQSVWWLELPINKLFGNKPFPENWTRTSLKRIFQDATPNF